MGNIQDGASPPDAPAPAIELPPEHLSPDTAVSFDWGDPETTREVDADGIGGAATAFAVRAFRERYQRGNLLGIGGMGEVRAWNDRASGREVAMKTIRGDRQQPIAAHRFAREARIQAQLEHPSIVPVYDLGVDDDGALFFTMKRVRGHSLSRVLATLWDRGEAAAGYSRRKLLTVIARVAMTLEYAHRRGVVNRDLKPANIMLGAFDEVYVIDWGLAAVTDPSAPPMTSRPDLVLGLPLSSAGMNAPLVDSSQRPETGSGQLIGTPGYVAPEQVHTPDSVDRRTDVYALGVVMFEVLAGQRLHAGDTLAEVLMSTLQTDGASPAARAPDRAIAPELDALCKWCTRLDPANRPQRAADVARAIEDYLDGDRDLERRRELASQSAEAAAASLDRARRAPDDHALRARALREVGGALALDPDNLSARRTLVRALTEPVRAMPPAAAEMFRADRERTYRANARAATYAMLTYALYVPLVMWMGLRHPWKFSVMAAAILTVTGLTYHYSRRPPAHLGMPWPHLAATTFSLCTGVWLFGSLVLLPAIVIITGAGYIGTFGRRSIYYMIPALAVVILPALLELVGVLPTTYWITNGVVAIQPDMLYFPATATTVLLLVTNAVIVGGSLIYVWRMRCNQLDVEERLQLQAWQLAQLVPAETHEVLGTSAS